MRKLVQIPPSLAAAASPICPSPPLVNLVVPALDGLPFRGLNDFGAYVLKVAFPNA